jgi:hypothetical protein
VDHYFDDEGVVFAVLSEIKGKDRGELRQVPSRAEPQVLHEHCSAKVPELQTYCKRIN